MATIFEEKDVLGSGNRVELVRQFDSGGQAEIWEVRDIDFQERIHLALKIYYADYDERQDTIFLNRSQRLENEYTILGRVDHRYIVKPHFRVNGEYTRDGKKYFYSGLTMSFAEEGNLDSFIRGKNYKGFSKRDRGIFLEQMVEGLAGVHSYEIIHNDIKPKNILIFRERDRFIPMYSDFGISFKIGDPPILGGTPAYIAPEILAGQSPSMASDIYSLGIVFCELLTGAHPLAGLPGKDESDYKKFLMGYHETHEFLPTEQVSSFGSPQLTDLIQRMCSRTVSHRPKLGEIAVTLGQLNFDISTTQVIQVKQLAPNLANKFKWNDSLHKALNESEYFFFIRGAKPDRDVAWLDKSLTQKRIYGYSLFRLLGSSDYLLRIWAGSGSYQQIMEILEDYSNGQKFGAFRQFTPTFKFPVMETAIPTTSLTRTSAINMILSLFKGENPKNEIDLQKLKQYLADQVIVGDVKRVREEGLPSEKRKIRVLLRIRGNKAPKKPMLGLITEALYKNLERGGDVSELEIFSEMGKGEPPCEFLLIFEMKYFFQYKKIFELVDRLLYELDTDLVGAFRTHFELDDVSVVESHDGSLAFEAIKSAT